MKKKVLASLLAVCMMAGLAVPAFAYTGDGYDSSSVSAEDDAVTELKFAKDSYTIAEDADPLNLAEELIAYAGDKAIVQDPVLEWSISDSLAFGINDAGEVSNIGEKTGTATVTVKSSNGKTASTKVVAAKGKTAATGVKFKDTKYATTDGATTINVKIIPSSDNGYFTDDQISAIEKWATSITAYSNKAKDKIISGVATLAVNDKGDAVSDKGGVEFTVDVDLLKNDATDNVGTYTLKLSDVKLPKADGSSSYSPVSRTTSIAKEDGKEATKLVRKSNIEIEVGQIVTPNDFIAYTTGANYNKGVTWSVDAYNDDAETSDYAVLNGKDDGDAKLLGVSVGKVKLIANATGKNYKDNNGSATIIVNVVAKGTLAKPDASAKYSITPATASPKVGDKVALTLNDADGKAVENVTWTVSNGALATVTTAANPTTLNAKAAGKVVVYARVADKVVATAEITVVGEGTTTTPPSVPGTSNPSTGDSIFSNLF